VPIRDKEGDRDMKIQYLKSLQHLARKKKAFISFLYLFRCYKWVGRFTKSDKQISAEDKSFTTMLQKLYKEVKKI
jgi:hypothetical protein